MHHKTSRCAAPVETILEKKNKSNGSMPIRLVINFFGFCFNDMNFDKIWDALFEDFYTLL